MDTKRLHTLSGLHALFTRLQDGEPLYCDIRIPGEELRASIRLQGKTLYFTFPGLSEQAVTLPDAFVDKALAIYQQLDDAIRAEAAT